MQSSEQSLHNNNFDFLRLLAASMVFLQHGLLFFDINPYIIFFPKVKYTLGLLGVTIFFIISGFLVTASFEKYKSMRVFILHRILRIYPGLIMSILIVILCLNALSTTLDFRDYVHCIAHNTVGYFFGTLILQIGNLPGCMGITRGAFSNSFPSDIVNGPLWTLSVEFGMYLIIALSGFCGLMDKKLFPLIFLATLIVFDRLKIFSDADIHTAESIAFFLGSAFYIYRESIPLRSVLAAVAVAVLAMVKVNAHYSWFNYSAASVMLLTSLTYLVIYLAFSPSVSLNRFGKNGDFSYGLYIYGLPVEHWIYSWLGAQAGLAVYLSISFSITMSLAILSWHGVEKPFLKLKRNISGVSSAGVPPLEGYGLR